MDTYRIGLCRTDITPPVGILLTGYATRKEPSTGVYAPLAATAVVLDDGTTPLLFVAADLLGFYDKAATVRRLLVEATGIAPEAVFLAGSHTHCGPALRRQDEETIGPLDGRYLDEAFHRIAEAGRCAWRCRVPARLRFGVGACAFAVSRRRPDPLRPGRVLPVLAPYRAGFRDPEVPVLAMETPEGRLIGVLFGYACHPTSRAGLEIGPDYPGFAREAVERDHLGATACFLQGCGADQKPAPVDPLAEEFGQRTVDQVRTLGEELAGAVRSVLRGDAMTPVTGPIRVGSRTVDLVTEPLDMEDVERASRGADPFMKEWARRMRAVRDRGEEPDRHVSLEVQAASFGSTLAMVALAAEATVEHGLRLKRDLAMRFRHVLPFAYCNAIVGYVPVKRQIPEGGHEVYWANRLHGRPGSFMEGTEDAIHRAALACLGME